MKKAVGILCLCVVWNLVGCGQNQSNGSREPAQEVNVQTKETARSVTQVGMEWAVVYQNAAAYRQLLDEENGCKMMRRLDVNATLRDLVNGTPVLCLETENKNHMKNCDEAQKRAVRITSTLNDLNQACTKRLGSVETAQVLFIQVVGYTMDMGLWPDKDAEVGPPRLTSR